MRIKLNGRPPREGFADKIGGLPLASDSMVIHSPDIEHLIRGINERVFRVNGGRDLPPQPEPGSFREMDYIIPMFVDKLNAPLPLSLEEYVSCYTGRKRTIAQQASEKFLRTGLQRSDAVVSLFGKREKLDIRRKPDPVQRIISPRTPVFNCALGRYTKAIEHNLYDCINRMFGYTVMGKGLNFVDTATVITDAWSSFNRPVSLGFDASRFDQHVSVSALRFEHRIYDAVFHGRYPELRKLLSHQIENKFIARHHQGVIKFKKAGGRCSGDMNTGLGNCVIMCCLWYHFFNTIMPNVKTRLVNNGDDCVIILERADATKLSKLAPPFFLRYGFTMVAETPKYVLEQVEFCQCQPVFNGDTYVMCRNPLAVQDKDAIRLNPFRNPDQFYSWVRAIGEGGISLTAGIPVLQSYYQSYARHKARKAYVNDDIDQSGLIRYAGGVHQKYRTVSDQARLSFYQAYNIAPSSQMELESIYDGLGEFAYTGGVTS